MAEADFTQDVSVANGNFGDAAHTGGGDGGPPKANEERKLFVGGLSFETREPQLKEYFEKFGEVETCNLKMNPMTGKSRCFAFVVYKEAASVAKVFEAGEHAINSKRVDVKRSKPKPGKIFVGGLKPEMTDEDVRAAFSKFGTIIEFEMPVDKVKKQRKNFGFITFEREDVMKDLVKRGKVDVGEHGSVDLRKATPKPDRGPQGGFGGGFHQGGYGGDYSGYGMGGGGYGGDYGYGGYGDFYGAQGGWGGYGGGWSGGYGASQGGGKMRSGMAGQKRGGAPY